MERLQGPIKNIEDLLKLTAPNMAGLNHPQHIPNSGDPIPPIKAIIVDDEPNARIVLRELLLKSNHDIDIVAECSNLVDAAEQIRAHAPGVVFLDIQMPNFAGYEIVKFFDKITFEVIFVTAFDEYALTAFEINAMDYLVKPIERERLARTLDKLNERVTVQRQTLEYEYLLNSMTHKQPQKLIIPEIGNRRIVEIGDIMAIEANGSYTSFLMHGSEDFMASKNLKYFEKRIGSDDRFFRSHRAYIVNLDYLEGLNKTDLTIRLKGNHSVKIARSRIEAFEKLML